MRLSSICKLIIYAFYFAVPQKIKTPVGQRPFRRPLAQLNSLVFVSDSGDDDDENIIVRSTWKTRHSKPKSLQRVEKSENEQEENRSPLLPSLSDFLRPPSNTPALTTSPKRTLSAPSRLVESSDSEEEFASLLERLKKKNNLTSTTFTPNTSKGKILINFCMPNIGFLNYNFFVS